MSREPRIAAELGRPETPQEIAERRAAASAKRRANQTALNLVLALVASFGLVALLVLVVVRADAPVREPIDYAAVGADAADSYPGRLVVPEPGEGWSANRAEVRGGGEGGVTTWQVGFLTPAEAYIGFTQAAEADPTWLAQELDAARATTVKDIAGAEWTVYDRRGERDVGNAAYQLSAEIDGETFVLAGTASDAEFSELAEAVTEAAR